MGGYTGVAVCALALRGEGDGAWRDSSLSRVTVPATGSVDKGPSHLTAGGSLIRTSQWCQFTVASLDTGRHPPLSQEVGRAVSGRHKASGDWWREAPAETLREVSPPPCVPSVLGLLVTRYFLVPILLLGSTVQKKKSNPVLCILQS